MTQTKPIPIIEYIQHHAAGGMYRPSRAVMRLLAVDPVAGQEAIEREKTDQAMGALRYAKRLLKQRFGKSKYVPHNGAREKLRRRVHGFHNVPERRAGDAEY